MIQTDRVDREVNQESGHTVTGDPVRHAMHAERPRCAIRWPAAVAAVLLLLGITVAVSSYSSDPVPSGPTSARSVTATARP